MEDIVSKVNGFMYTAQEAQDTGLPGFRITDDGMAEWAVRREIRRLRDGGEPILTDTERGGYWMAGAEDYSEMLRYYRTLTAYIRSLHQLARKYRQWLREHEEKGRPGESPEAATNKNTTYSIEHCAKDVKECGYGQEI